MTEKTSSLVEIKSCLQDILRNSRGATDVLHSQAFTSEADEYLVTLSDEEREGALSLLNDKDGPFPYFHETHDFDQEPFKEDGSCRHGLDWWTCPCGCGSL